jgi:hypothetical protein
MNKQEKLVSVIDAASTYVEKDDNQKYGKSVVRTMLHPEIDPSCLLE